VACPALGLLGLLAVSAIAPPGAPALPPRTDLAPAFRRLGLLPRAQGERDTCSLFAITALAEFESLRAAPQPHKRLSEEFLIWAANKATGRDGDQAMFYEAVHGLNALGICAEERMPYARKADPGRAPSAAALADAKQRSGRWRLHWIKRWDVQRPLSGQELRAIKEALASGHPVACGLRWPKSLNGHQLLAVPPPGSVFDGHSVAFVGYQDEPGTDAVGTFTFRNSAGPGWGDEGYGVMSYAYARAYANDILWLELGAPGSEVPAERFEAESLPLLSRDRCRATPQDMAGWGGPMWSQGRQLFCGGQSGGSVELGLSIRVARRYRLRVLATAAPDYGVVRPELDGSPAGADSDLYSGRVCPSGALELGTHALTAGQHRLRFTVVAKNPASAGHAFGLDAVELFPTD
jgi:hypothetical protein